MDTDEVPLEDIPEQKPRKGTNAKTVIISVILSIVLVTVGLLYRMDRLPPTLRGTTHSTSLLSLQLLHILYGL